EHPTGVEDDESLRSGREAEIARVVGVWFTRDLAPGGALVCRSPEHAVFLDHGGGRIRRRDLTECRGGPALEGLSSVVGEVHSRRDRASSPFVLVARRH